MKPGPHLDQYLHMERLRGTPPGGCLGIPELDEKFIDFIGDMKKLKLKI